MHRHKKNFLIFAAVLFGCALLAIGIAAYVIRGETGRQIPGGYGDCPPGYVQYGVPLGCITQKQQEYCRSHPCPICLSFGTKIATPKGDRDVETLVAGDPVWSVTAAGERISVPVLRTSRVWVPADTALVLVKLEDGRSLFVSPYHLTRDGRHIGDLNVNDRLDGSRIIEASSVPYAGHATYDVLPAGETGYYWANGILLASTLKR